MNVGEIVKKNLKMGFYLKVKKKLQKTLLTPI